MTGAEVPLEIVGCDGLEKVLPDRAPRPLDASIPLIGYAGERTALQVALRVPDRAPGSPGFGVPVRLRVRAPEGVRARLRRVELVDVRTPCTGEIDPAEYLTTEPGLLPDLLRPMDDDEEVLVVPGRRHAIWVGLEIDADAPTARGTVAVDVLGDGLGAGAGDGVGGDIGAPVLGTVEAPLEVIGVRLPALSIVATHWFHGDGIAWHYDAEPLSERWWGIVERFLGSLAGMSATSVLTPVWTPPLDTAEGATRMTVQLLGFADDGDGRYRFDTAPLERWIAVARRAGITHLELPHLFTQWGARATPAILVDTPEGRQRRFGWDVPATDPAYRALLEQMLPVVLGVLEREIGLDHVIAHVSDEPRARDRESYAAARAVVADLLAGVRVVDALSSVDLYREGLVPHPVVAADHVGPFLAAGVEGMWVYHCVEQRRGVANRFIAQPSTTTRVLGSQLFCAGAGGFLHWGFNFYNSALSRRGVDPFVDTCAGGAFPGGDAFLVYPGAGGEPLPSLRYEAMADAMRDHRVGQALEARLGRERAVELLRPDQDGPAAPGPYALPPGITADDLRRREVAAARALVAAEEAAKEESTDGR